MIPKQRQVATLDNQGRAEIITEPLPPTGPGAVLVRVQASLISPGTELSAVRQARQKNNGDPGQRRPFGYQNAGVVVAAGKGVTRFKPGDRVACMGADALHATYAVVPQNLCAAIPEGVSYEEAAFTHLAITALNAIRRGRPDLGEYGLVVGLGLVGQMAARLGQLAGLYVMGWDTLPFRGEVAQRWGIDAVAVVGRDNEVEKAKTFTRGYGFDLAVLAIGGNGTPALQTVKTVMKVTPDGHAMGRICLVGGTTTECRWGAGMGNLDLLSCARTGPGYHDAAWESAAADYPRVFVRWTTRTNMELVLRLMAEKRFGVQPLITHQVPLEKIHEVIDAHLDHPDTALGTVLRMSHPE